MPLSPTRRGHIDSDSDESKNRIRPLEDDDPKPHLSYYEREHYPPAQYPYIDSNNGKPRHHAYTDIGREHHSSSAYPSSIPSDRLPQLAPQPPQHPIEEDAEPSGSQHQHQQQRQYSSQHSHVKKELAGAEPFKIQSARGTPKGPLPIDVQISLLRSVLKYDPYNCAIRKTTQAWEMISREQGIRARTCSRRFDNIIQANIGGRDRPVGTEEQQATKKKLLDQLFDMMNQPQALKRMQKKRRYRSEDTDRKLLVETIRLNPFAQKVGQVAKAWEDVRDALNMKVHARQCIRRVNRMVKPYQLRERMYKGNIPNEMREANDDLVKQVIQLMRSAGQSGSLDDACNSNDEDSAFYNSDSEEQDNYMDSKRQRNNQEDDELEEDDDEEMVSRSESEQQATGKSQEEGARPIRVTSRSPTVLASSPTSTHPTTPSLTISATSATDVPSSSSGPTTPTKRSRNSLPSTQSSQPSGLGPSDKSRPPTDGGSEEIAPAHTSHPNGPGQTHHYPQGEYEQSEYRGPVKHAQTSSRGGRDLPMDMSHHDRSRTISPGIGQPHGHHIREETYHRYETHPSKGQAVDSHGRPVDYTPSNREAVDSYARRGHHVTIAISDEAQQSSSQYQDIASELRHMRECLAQMEEHRRVDMDKQRSMMYMIEKLQSQMQQQQRHMHELQSQLRYSSSYPPQQTAPPPPPHSPHNSPHHHEQSQQPSLPFQGGLPGSVAPYQKSMSGTGRPLDRHSQGIQLHSSYSRSEAHYASHDREMR
ncbi:hypothetical protein BGX27_007083 [Mortierella sp. AM989]|nr:hypothetical protein BGX27_007083 [Mortierella sp. AM989]